MLGSSSRLGLAWWSWGMQHSLLDWISCTDYLRRKNVRVVLAKVNTMCLNDAEMQSVIVRSNINLIHDSIELSQSLWYLAF
jgi:hypothetical protein